MKIKNKLEKLAAEKNNACVSISLNTHRTHPENAQDVILLKNLLKEAEDRLIAEFGGRPVASLLEKITTVSSEIDINHNLDSLHIFLSNDTKEIIKSVWSVNQNEVQISETFALRQVIKAYNRSEEYLILLLSQIGVHLYSALNESIVSEVRNDDFPFSDNTHSSKSKDTKHADNKLREFINKVDKAIQKVHHETEMHCVVICTEDNHNLLMQVADQPNVYLGYATVDYNNIATNHIAGQGWEIIRIFQQKLRDEAVIEIKEAVAKGNVLTDLQAIYQASIDGRGDLLAVNKDFEQPVLMTSDRTFELVTDISKPKVIDDITSNIAWEVLSKKGHVVFIEKDQLKELGNIILKTRY